MLLITVQGKGLNRKGKKEAALKNDINRREFLQLTAAGSALCLVALGCQGQIVSSERKYPKLVSPGCRGTKVKVARIYMGKPDNPYWPKPRLDVRKEIRFYESEFAKLQGELRDVAFVVDELVTCPAEIGQLQSRLKKADGILVPGGFGIRGIEGKINATSYARINNIPFFGICLGMDCATIEYARNIASLTGANSTEFNSKTPHRIFVKWRELKGVKDIGGTMRLGQYACRLKKDSFAAQAYKKVNIYERHRHRYEFNPEYEEILTKAGLYISGRNPDTNLVEIVEVRNHPWFLGCQFHPEFKSKPLKPHPLFKAFIGASYDNQIQRNRHK